VLRGGSLSHRRAGPRSEEVCMRRVLMTGALLAVFLGIGTSANYSRFPGSDAAVPIPDSSSTPSPVAL
jgi:hypothetical protein